jgi:hypothetical protein
MLPDHRRSHDVNERIDYSDTHGARRCVADQADSGTTNAPVTQLTCRHLDGQPPEGTGPHLASRCPAGCHTRIVARDLGTNPGLTRRQPPYSGKYRLGNGDGRSVYVIFDQPQSLIVTRPGLLGRLHDRLTSGVETLQDIAYGVDEGPADKTDVQYADLGNVFGIDRPPPTTGFVAMLGHLVALIALLLALIPVAVTKYRAWKRHQAGSVEL